MSDDKKVVNLEPNIWIVFKKSRDESNQPVILFNGLSHSKLEVSKLTEEGWNAVRVGRDWKPTMFPLRGMST